MRKLDRDEKEVLKAKLMNNYNLVYICHPYSAKTIFGIKRNIRKANKGAKLIYDLNKDVIPIVPHNIFPFLIGDKTDDIRNGALNADIEVLSKCDALIVCSEKTTDGMFEEIKYAMNNHIPIIDVHAGF